MAEELVLNTGAMRIVTRNEQGNVTYRKHYRRGDVVDVSKIDDARVEALREDRVLVPKSEMEQGADGTPEDSEGQDGPTGESTDTGAAGAGTDAPDVYDGMDYNALRTEAKSRGLDAAGSADDLRVRLREDDAADSGE